MSDLTSILTADAKATLPRFPNVQHIPGEKGLPVVGSTFRILRDPDTYTKVMHSKYGPVYRHRAFGIEVIVLLGPDANELVLFDRNKIFSSDLGWTPTLELLFPRGLMLLDFEVHRGHRKIMQTAFKTEAMRGYIESLNEGIKNRLNTWANTPDFLFYPAVKTLTLDLAAAPFLGISWGPDADRINQSFIDMVAATIAPVRRPWPLTAMARGTAGRRYLCEYFGAEIPKRRGSNAQDMFSILCNATDEEGNSFNTQEIIDHMNFLMMAAHDTITSSLTSSIYELAKNPDWQDEVRTEMLSLKLEGSALPYDQLAKLQTTEMVFKEVLRIHPPVPVIPRRAIQDFSFAGYDVPAGAIVGINPLFTHQMEEYWPQPERFDPRRFTSEETAKRHKYAWVPFGGGAHMCLGLHFAYMQSKVFLWHLLTKYKVELETGYTPQWRPWPIYKPNDGLPIKLKAL